MISKKTSILAKVLGRYHQQGKDEYYFHCPFCKHHKKKLALNIDKNLYTKGIPDPDLLIRTGNTRRLSNFLLWQIAYSEIYFVKKLWPDFNEKDYNNILLKFQKTIRKFGNI